MPSVELYHGDNLDIFPLLEDESVDTVITDPPYGYQFMSKSWDHGVPGVRYWAECLRVAKPGAMLCAFGGTRTHHRLMCAIEDAGWEIRDCMMLFWNYGSGFPKSHNIGKAIDKAAGAEREVVGERHYAYPDSENVSHISESGRAGLFKQEFLGSVRDITAPATDAAALWDGYGTALKPAYEPIILAMKPLPGTFAQNALGYGVAGLNVDGCRVPSNGESLARPFGYGGIGAAQLNAIPKGTITGENLTGRWPANLLLSHAPGCECVGVRKVRGSKDRVQQSTQDEGKGRSLNTMMRPAGYTTPGYADPDGTETVEAWDCVPECPVFLLDQSSGERPSGGVAGNRTHPEAGQNCYGKYNPINYAKETSRPPDTGGASRFFTRFAPSAELWYTSKDTIQYAIGRCLQCGNESDEVTLFCVGESQEAGQSIANQNTPMSGSRLTGQFLTGSLSTIETGTKETTDLKICNSSAENIIHGIIQITSERPGMDGNAVARCATCGSLWMVSTSEARQDSNDTVRNAAASSSGNGSGQTGTRCKDTSNDTSATENEYAQTRFRYSSKASRRERELGLLGHIPCLKCGEPDSVTHINPKTGKEEKCRRNGHPTVKPLDVCRWLCRLTRTPTGGVVLDPFMGSGRISMAAILEGRDTIGIELERPSFEIAQAAVRWAEEQVLDMVQGELEYA